MPKPKRTWRDIVFAYTDDGFHVISLAIVTALVIACVAAAVDRLLTILHYPFP